MPSVIPAVIRAQAQCSLQIILHIWIVAKGAIITITTTRHMITMEWVCHPYRGSITYIEAVGVGCPGAIDVKRGLEQREFLLSNDKEFHRQIHSIKRTSNGGKYFRYDAERNEKGHADSFWAWALANSAVVITDNKSLNFYAQRKQKKLELMQGLSPEKAEQLKKKIRQKRIAVLVV